MNAEAQKAQTRRTFHSVFTSSLRLSVSASLRLFIHLILFFPIDTSPTQNIVPANNSNSRLRRGARHAHRSNHLRRDRFRNCGGGAGGGCVLRGAAGGFEADERG